MTNVFFLTKSNKKHNDLDKIHMTGESRASSQRILCFLAYDKMLEICQKSVRNLSEMSASVSKCQMLSDVVRNVLVNQTQCAATEAATTKDATQRLVFNHFHNQLVSIHQVSVSPKGTGRQLSTTDQIYPSNKYNHVNIFMPGVSKALFTRLYNLALLLLWSFPYYRHPML